MIFTLTLNFHAKIDRVRSRCLLHTVTLTLQLLTCVPMVCATRYVIVILSKSSLFLSSPPVKLMCRFICFHSSEKEDFHSTGVYTPKAKKQLSNLDQINFSSFWPGQKGGEGLVSKIPNHAYSRCLTVESPETPEGQKPLCLGAQHPAEVHTALRVSPCPLL